MSENRPLPEFPASALRDHATPARVARIWRRLEAEWPPVRPTKRSVIWWQPAAAALVFGLGVFVGTQWTGQPVPFAPSAEPALVPLPPGGPETPEPEPEPGPREQRRNPVPRGRVLLPHLEAPASVPAIPELLPQQLPAPRVTEKPEWARLIEEGEYRAAWQALGQDGFDTAVRSASSARMMDLVDLARGAKQGQQAVWALRLLLERYPYSEEAPDAAFTLGAMLQAAGDRRGAAEAFALYRRLSAQGDLAEDAVARQVEVAIEEGNVEEARQLTHQYAKEFPNSGRLGEICRQLVRLADAQKYGLDSGLLELCGTALKSEDPEVIP
jgi:hypothetical protein